MSRILFAALVATLSGSAGTAAVAADLPGCLPHARHHHHHLAVRRGPPAIVYGRAEPRPYPPVYNHEDNGAYDGADLPPQRRLAYGQPASWLDGYGTRPVVYGAYGTYNVYGGSSQVWPYGIGPAGGLSVYSPGAYGPGPSIVEIPNGY